MLNVNELIGFGVGGKTLKIARGAVVSSGDGSSYGLSATDGGIESSDSREIYILWAGGSVQPSSVSCTVNGNSAQQLSFTSSGSKQSAAAFKYKVGNVSGPWSVVVSLGGSDITGEGSLLANWCCDEVDSSSPLYSIGEGSPYTLTASGSPAAFLAIASRFGGPPSLSGTGLSSWTTTHPWGNWWYEAADKLLTPTPDLTLSGSGAKAFVTLW